MDPSFHQVVLYVILMVKSSDKDALHLQTCKLEKLLDVGTLFIQTKLQILIGVD
jgi:hypothetical protein